MLYPGQQCPPRTYAGNYYTSAEACRQARKCAADEYVTYNNDASSAEYKQCHCCEKKEPLRSRAGWNTYPVMK